MADPDPRTEETGEKGQQPAPPEAGPAQPRGPEDESSTEERSDCATLADSSVAASIATLPPLLDELNLLTEVEAWAFLDALPEERRRALRSAADFAQELAKAGKLTAFQAAVLAKGRGKDLAIDHYVVMRQIGAGGMGKVYQVRHRRLRKLLALKLVDPAFARSRLAIERFRREIEATAQLSHPNLVVAYDAGEFNGRPYFVMEYVDGTDLSRLVREQGGLPLDLAIDAIRQAALGLKEAHQHGIIHRDIKPHNLLLANDGTVKVSDLGLARYSAAAGPDGAEHELTRFGTVLGSVYYIAPEQARNARDADHRSDIYGLGCTLHTLLIGLPPFRGETAVNVVLAHRLQPIPSLRDQRPDVPQALDDLFQRMVAKDPNDRPQSMCDVIDALTRCRSLEPTESASGSGDRNATGLAADAGSHHQSDLGLTLPDLKLDEPTDPAKPATPSSPPARRGRRWVTAAAALAVIGLGALAIHRWRSAPPPAPEVVDRNRPERRQTAGSNGTLQADAEGADIDLEGDWVTHNLESTPVDTGEDQATATDPSMVDLPPPTEPAEPIEEVNHLEASDGPPGAIHTFTGHRGDLRALAVRPEGATALTGSSDGTVRLWGLKTGRMILAMDFQAIVNAVASGPAGRFAAFGGASDAVFLVDLERLIEAGRSGDRSKLEDTHQALRGFEGPVHALAIAPDGATLLAASETQGLLGWNLPDGDRLEQFGTDDPEELFFVSFSPDGARFLTSGSDRRLRLRRFETGADEIAPLWQPAGTRSAVFLPDGGAVLAAGLDGLLRYWNLETGRMSWRIDTGQGRLLGVAVSENGRFALTCGERDLALWETADGRLLHRFPVEEEQRAVAFIPGRNLALSVGKDGAMTLWRLPDSNAWGTAPEPIPADQELGAGKTRAIPGRYPLMIIREADERAIRNWFSECRRREFIPIDVDVHDSAGLSLFSAVAEPNVNRVPWQGEVIRGTDPFEATYQQRTQRGEELLTFDACYQGPEKINIGVFVRTGEADRSWRVGLVPDEEAVASFLQGHSAAGRRPNRVDSYVAGDARRLAVQTVPEDGTGWQLEHDLSAEDLIRVLNEAKRRGFRPVDISADHSGGESRHAVLLLQDRSGRNWDLDLAVPEDEWPELLERRIAAGFRPASISTYRAEGRTSYLALWARP